MHASICLISLLEFSFTFTSSEHVDLHSFPTRRSSDLLRQQRADAADAPDAHTGAQFVDRALVDRAAARHHADARSEEHTSELQSPVHLVYRLLLEKKT